VRLRAAWLRWGDGQCLCDGNRLRRHCRARTIEQIRRNCVEPEGCPDRRKAAAMVLAGTVTVEGGEMGRRRVAHVILEAIAGKSAPNRGHEAVASYLCDDRGRGDR